MSENRFDETEFETSRDVLPYTDSELAELYKRATPSQERESFEAVLWRSSEFHTMWVRDRTLWIFFVIAVLTAFLTPLLTWPIAVAIAFFFGYILNSLWEPAEKKPIGPFSKAAFQELRRQYDAQTPAGVNVNDPAVLATIVNYLVSVPMRESERIQRSIERQRESVQNKISQLWIIVSELEQDIRSTKDERLRLLIASRYDRARAAIDRLGEADQDLQNQHREAQEAVRPVVELRQRFERMRLAERTLETIQSANELADLSEEVIELNKIELAMLREIIGVATTSLKEIEAGFSAAQQARSEVLDLRFPT